MKDQNDKPNMHPAKVYLRQYNDMKLRRDDLREELITIRQNATRATSRMTAERVSGTSARDSMANAAVKAVEAEKRLERLILNITEALDMRASLIERMKDEREKTLLTEFYIRNRSVEEIQKRMFISRSTFWRIHGYALQNFWYIYLHRDESWD